MFKIIAFFINNTVRPISDILLTHDHVISLQGEV